MNEIITYLFKTYRLDSNEIKQAGKRKVLTTEELVKELGSYADDENLDWSKQSRIDAVTTWKNKTSELKNKPHNDVVVDFISSVFVDHEVVVNENQTYTQSNIQIDEMDVYTLLEAKMFDWNRENPDNKLSAPELKAKLKEMGRMTAFNYRKELIETLKFDSYKVSAMDKWLKNAYETLQIVQDYPIFESMMKHWIWLVKRKMAALPTKNQFVLNFHGKTGTGKSFFVKLFTSPLEKFRHNNATLEVIKDVRSTIALGNNFVHFIDEMCTGGIKTISSDQELAMLKNIITADTELSMRVLGSNTDIKVTPKTSFIAASNFHIYEIILDSSGMRRWFELNVGLESHKYDINRFQFLRDTILDVWNGVDENNDNGYWIVTSEIGKKISDIQDGYVRKDSFDLWLESVNITEGSMNGPVAHELYKEYCEVEGMEHKTKMIASFYNRLSSMNIQNYRVHGYTKINKMISKKTPTLDSANEEPQTITITKKTRVLGNMEGIL